jgi:hypothetical protein
MEVWLIRRAQVNNSDAIWHLHRHGERFDLTLTQVRGKAGAKHRDPIFISGKLCPSGNEQTAPVFNVVDTAHAEPNTADANPEEVQFVAQVTRALKERKADKHGVSGRCIRAEELTSILTGVQHWESAPWAEQIKYKDVLKKLRAWSRTSTWKDKRGNTRTKTGPLNHLAKRYPTPGSTGTSECLWFAIPDPNCPAKAPDNVVPLF